MRPLGHGGAQGTTDRRSDIMNVLPHMAMASQDVGIFGQEMRRRWDVWTTLKDSQEEFLKEILYLLR